MKILLLLWVFSADAFLPTTTRPSQIPLASSAKDSALSTAQKLTDSQRDFVVGYLNKHHSDLLLDFCKIFSPIGKEMAEANVWSGGSFQILSSTMKDINRESISLEAIIQRRGKEKEPRQVEVPLNAKYKDVELVPEDEIRLPIDDVVRKLCRLCWIAKHPSVTGKLMQLAIQLNGAGVGKLPENMYLNQVPHNVYIRQYFYDLAAIAIEDAVKSVRIGTLPTNRLKMVTMFPETNPSMDSYRIGTLLEMVRNISLRLAGQGTRVKICVQRSMGVGIFTGLPKQLSGVSRLLEMMDWQNEPGELYESLKDRYIRFGSIGASEVAVDDEVFLLIAPQSMVGTDSSILPFLVEMVEAAGEKRPIILINADLIDKVSSAGQQSVRGRQQRIDFANSFQTVFHFQNIYVSGTSYFPILGAITKLHPTEPWIAHQRRDFVDGGEIYVPVLTDEKKPSGEMILESFE